MFVYFQAAVSALLAVSVLYVEKNQNEILRNISRFITLRSHQIRTNSSSYDMPTTLSHYLAWVHLIPSWQVFSACCSVQMAHKPVQESRQQMLRAYCPNIYTVPNIMLILLRNFFGI